MVSSWDDIFDLKEDVGRRQTGGEKHPQSKAAMTSIPICRWQYALRMVDACMVSELIDWWPCRVVGCGCMAVHSQPDAWLHSICYDLDRGESIMERTLRSNPTLDLFGI